jgi:hypothetical protein
MAHQNLNGAEISTGLEQMSSEAMPKHVGMGTNLDSGSLGGLLACIPNRFRNDRPIRAVAALPGKSQTLGLCPTRYQCSRSSSSNLRLSITSRSYVPGKVMCRELRSISKRHRLLRIALVSRCVDDSA